MSKNTAWKRAISRAGAKHTKAILSKEVAMAATRKTTSKKTISKKTTSKKTASKKAAPGKTASAKGRGKVEKVMHEYKHGQLKSGKSGKAGKVKSRKQAIAIGLSEARKAGAKIPRKPKKA
jgi:hypothetical protein